MTTAAIALAVAVATSLFLPGGRARAADGPAAVIVVRHAEKADAPGDDPPLAAPGVERARALAAVLEHARVDVVITTQYRRTRETAEPVARRGGLTPLVVVAGRDAAAHVEEVATLARRQPPGSVVLVVGHSNTVPAIVAALGGPRPADLREDDYARLFTLLRTGGSVRLVSSTYGRVPDLATLTH